MSLTSGYSFFIFITRGKTRKESKRRGLRDQNIEGWLFYRIGSLVLLRRQIRKCALVKSDIMDVPTANKTFLFQFLSKNERPFQYLQAAPIDCGPSNVRM